MVDYRRKSRNNGMLLIADSVAILVGRSLVEHTPNLLDGAFLLVTEAFGVILLADSIWIYFAEKNENKKSAKIRH